MTYVIEGISLRITGETHNVEDHGTSHVAILEQECWTDELTKLIGIIVPGVGRVGGVERRATLAQKIGWPIGLLVRPGDEP